MPAQFRPLIVSTGLIITAFLLLVALPEGSLFGVSEGGMGIPHARAQEAPTQIEDRHGSMAHYYRRLRSAAANKRGAIARASVYSESTNAADRVTSGLRRRLQQRFGDSGKGFVPVVPGWPAQHHQDIEWSNHGGWRTWVVNRNNGPLDRYGLAGVVATNRSANSTATFATMSRGRGSAVSTYQLFYQAYPEGGAVNLAVDGGAPETVSTRAAQVEDRVHEIQVADGAHSLELSISEGSSRLYGMVMERDRPGAVVDGLMLVGAFTRVLNHFDSGHWARQVALRESDLIVFWLGGNDASSVTTGFNPGQFTQRYTQAIGNARRGRPEASCLVVSVLDVAEESGGGYRTRPRVPQVVRAQREAAANARCAFFDLFAAAGGNGTMVRWRRHSPRLAGGDYKHLTRQGADRVGEILFDALMHGYAQSGGS